MMEQELFHLLQARLVDLEIRLALQDDTIESLNQTITRMRDQLDNQQQQLRLLYQRIDNQDKLSVSSHLLDQIPPHY